MNNHDWDWLADTWWYVPTVYLPALEYQPSAEQPYVWLSDQTLWHLEMYRAGYVTGRVWAKLSSNDAEPTYSCTTLVGSVTPDGNVYFSFVSDSTLGAAMATTGIGRMRQNDSGWAFEMQMGTGVTSLITHWAFMEQCRPNDEAWNQLPGTNQSVPEFVQVCNQACSESGE